MTGTELITEADTKANETEGEEMGRYKYAVMATGRPFGPCEPTTESDFRHTVSRHTSYNAAARALDRQFGEMHARCGPGAWDNHYTIFALRAIQWTTELRCNVCLQPRRYDYTWEPGEEPAMPETCPECEERQQGMSAVEVYEDCLQFEDEDDK